jgi:hypothetical protein
MTTAVQTWIALVAGFATALLGVLKYFNYKSRRDRLALVGEHFGQTVEALGSQDQVRRLAAAILLRRFFDRRTEQGSSGAPYQYEAIRVIAALLRATEVSQFQKLLADGLAFAPDICGADLQECNLSYAYLGTRLDREVDLSEADLYKADLTGASLKGAKARKTVFYGAVLKKTVLEGAILVGADFRDADLDGARFAGAVVGGARFAGAKNIPPAITTLLGPDEDGTAVPESHLAAVPA